MTKHEITNTEKLARERPDVVLAESLILGMSNAIEASERSGQAELLASETLPVDTHDSDAAFEAIGFRFGDPVDGDPIFRAATLPSGWTRKGSDHSMLSHIYDDEGFQRVGIFYKAAFYDRSAHMSLNRVPRTDAQADAISAIYQSLGGFKKGEPWWGDMHEEERSEDRAVVATWTLLEVHPYPQPETIYATRRVVVLPDGSIESDETV